MAVKLNGVVSKDKDGFYAHCPDLPGCYSQGDTNEEALANLREASQLYMETMTESEIKALGDKADGGRLG